MGTITNFGTCLMTIFYGTLNNYLPTKKLLVICLLLNVLSCIIITFSFNYIILVINRAIQGVTMGYYLIFNPIWINQNAPFEKQTTWIAINTAVAPLGIVFGYAVTGMISNYINWIHIWRVGILFQAVLLLPVLFLLLIFDQD